MNFYNCLFGILELLSYLSLDYWPKLGSNKILNGKISSGRYIVNGAKWVSDERREHITARSTDDSIRLYLATAPLNLIIGLLSELEQDRRKIRLIKDKK